MQKRDDSGWNLQAWFIKSETSALVATVAACFFSY